MDTNDAAFQAALRTFEQSHPDAATWLAWLWERIQEHSAKFRETDARLDAISERICTMEIDHEDYAALRDAHDALQLEHADLEAAYFVLQRRASKEKDLGEEEG